MLNDDPLFDIFLFAEEICTVTKVIIRFRMATVLTFCFHFGFLIMKKKFINY